MTEHNIAPAEVQKNTRETLRLAVDEYKGRTLLSCRVWYEPREGGELRPGRDGFAISIEKLPDVIAGLRVIEAEAKRAGLLP